MKLKMSYDSILIKSLLTSGAIVCKLRLTSMGAKALIHDLKDPPTLFLLIRPYI